MFGVPDFRKVVFLVSCKKQRLGVHKTERLQPSDVGDSSEINAFVIFKVIQNFGQKTRNIISFFDVFVNF